MSLDRLSACIAAALLLASCARESVPATAPRYPALPKPAPAAGQFVPDPALVEVQLACRASDSPDNGLDDDCDGVIDGPRGAATQLTIAATHRAEFPTDVRLDLTSPAGDAVPNLAIERTSARSPTVSLTRLDLSTMPSGRYRLTAARQTAEAEPAELSLAVSLATKEKARTYLVVLGAGETRTLGVIEVQ